MKVKINLKLKYVHYCFQIANCSPTFLQMLLWLTGTIKSRFYEPFCFAYGKVFGFLDKTP